MERPLDDPRFQADLTEDERATGHGRGGDISGMSSDRVRTVPGILLETGRGGRPSGKTPDETPVTVQPSRRV